MKDFDEKSFSGRLNQFILNFPHGNRISTIWGAGSYTENWMKIDNFDKVLASHDVEIMVDCRPALYKKLQRRFKTSDSVFNYLSIKQWLKVVNEVAAEPTPKRKSKV